jgi:hypothetical protein
MKLEHAKAIVDAAFATGCGDDEISVREDYSGRGMSGKGTAGIVYGPVGVLLSAVVYLAATWAAADEDADSERVTALTDDLRKCSTDSMGRDTIIY